MLALNNKILNYFYIVVWSYFFYLMVLITIQYIPINSDVAFLRIKQEEVKTVPYYLTIFYIHVYSSIFVLFFGILQFNKSILKKHKAIHRILGRVYAYGLIFFAAPSGIFIGYYANGGWTSQASFILLGILWIYFTSKAILNIKNKDIVAHKHNMMRSYALTLSAITLRFWKLIIVYLFHPPPMDVYQFVAWFGWVPNLILINYLIHKKYV